MVENKIRTFNKTLKDIKNHKIQGARNIAKAAIKAYFLIPTETSKKKLFSSRPTEPMLQNVVNLLSKNVTKENYNKILNHFDSAQNKINNYVFKIIKNNDVIFTHCHSTNVVNALIYAKKKGKNFEVYNTETRPLYQGRKTARELRKAGIKVTMFIDSALEVALLKEQGTKKVNKVFLGADALLKKGIINKIGSRVIAQIAEKNKIPVYIIADSWKYSIKPIKIEQRSLKEIWKKAPKNIRIKNPSFEFVPKKYIKAIISELGILSYEKFLKKISNRKIKI